MVCKGFDKFIVIGYSNSIDDSPRAHLRKLLGRPHRCFTGISFGRISSVAFTFRVPARSMCGPRPRFCADIAVCHGIPPLSRLRSVRSPFQHDNWSFLWPAGPYDATSIAVSISRRPAKSIFASCVQLYGCSPRAS